MNNTAQLFAQNRDEILPAIAPAGQTNLGLSSTFNSTVMNGGGVQKLDVAPALPENDNKANLDKQQLAMRAEETGYSLKESLQVLPKQKLGDAGFLGAKVGEACTELTSQVFNLFGAKPDAPDMAPERNAPSMNPMMGMNMNMQMRPGAGFGGLG